MYFGITISSRLIQRLVGIVDVFTRYVGVFNLICLVSYYRYGPILLGRTDTRNVAGVINNVLRELNITDAEIGTEKVLIR